MPTDLKMSSGNGMPMKTHWGKVACEMKGIFRAIVDRVAWHLEGLTDWVTGHERVLLRLSKQEATGGRYQNGWGVAHLLSVNTHVPRQDYQHVVNPIRSSAKLVSWHWASIRALLYSQIFPLKQCRYSEANYQYLTPWFFIYQWTNLETCLKMNPLRHERWNVPDTKTFDERDQHLEICF